MNNRIVFSALALVAASAAFFMLVIKPKRDEASTLKTQITEQQRKLDEAKALLASNQEARKVYRSAYASVVRLGKAVPADDDVRSLVVQLDSAAKRTGVDFRSIDVSGGAAAPVGDSAGAASAVQLPPGATVGPAGFPTMPFSFAFTGSFFDLGDFFKRLEGFVKSKPNGLTVNGRLLSLDGLQLQPDTEGFPHIRATVNATSYLVSPLEGATGGATAQGPATAATAGQPGSAPAPATGSAPAPTTATSTGVIR